MALASPVHKYRTITGETLRETYSTAGATFLRLQDGKIWP